MMKTFKVTIFYVDRDGQTKNCSIVRSTTSAEEARQYAIRFFFRDDERHMVRSVKVVEED